VVHEIGTREPDCPGPVPLDARPLGPGPRRIIGTRVHTHEEAAERAAGILDQSRSGLEKTGAGTSRRTGHVEELLEARGEDGESYMVFITEPVPLLLMYFWDPSSLVAYHHPPF
jgi:hypothetical protein